jgi:hypothetical protein
MDRHRALFRADDICHGIVAINSVQLAQSVARPHFSGQYLPDVV